MTGNLNGCNKKLVKVEHILSSTEGQISNYKTYNELPQKENKALRENPHISANKHKNKEAISTMTKEMRPMSF